MHRKFIQVWSNVISPVAGELVIFCIFVSLCKFSVCIFPSREEKAFGLEVHADLVSCCKSRLLGALSMFSGKSERRHQPSDRYITVNSQS